MNRKKSRKVLWGLIPIILFGFIIGYTLWYTNFEFPPHRYDLDFKEAMWISPGKQMPHGYFVKEIFISEGVSNSWIAVAATDNVSLFINGDEIAFEKFVSLNVSGIYDITGKFKQGRNVIAASVSRTSYPGSAKLLLKGVYIDLSGKRHVFSTDDKWKASSVEETQGQGDIQWSSAIFDHSRWKNAVAEGDVTKFPIYTSPIPPYILGESLSGFWIWHPLQNVRHANFVKSFSLNLPVKDGIIGIAGISSYDLTVNNITISKNNIYDNSLHIFNITPLLHSGNNIIEIGVNAKNIAPGLFINGYIQHGNSIIDLKSDSTWKTISIQRHKLDIVSSDWKEPVLLGKYPAKPWGVLLKKVKEIDLPVSYTLHRLLKISAFIFAVTAATICLWLISAYLFTRIKKEEFLNRLVVDSCFHMPPALFMFLIYLLKFDVRFDSSFPFQLKFVVFSLSFLFFIRAVELTGLSSKKYSGSSYFTADEKLTNRLSFYLIILLMTIGALIRIQGLDSESLSHDEIGMMQFTKGLLTEGYPFKEIGSFKKPITTYELIPYSISIPVTLFGFNGFAGRLHSVFWGTLEILILYLLGRTLFNRKIGLSAATICTFHPWCIGWSQNLFYPQMTQCLATLTIFFYYKSINPTPMSKKFLYITGVFFSLMYLSWEGSGLLLISFGLVLLIHRRFNLSWLTNRHVWGTLAIVVLTVFIQQSRRTLYQEPYLAVGASNADVSMPQMYFLDPMYNPYFYIINFFLKENNYMLTVFMLVGLPLFFKHRPLSYLYTLILCTALFKMNFLAVDSERYVFYLEPLLIIIPSAVVFLYINLYSSLINKKSLMTRLSISLTIIFLLLILFMTSNNILLKSYLLSKNPSDPSSFNRKNIYWVDYRSTSEYVKNRIKKGDLIFTMMPHTLYYYTGIDADYSLITLISKTLIFDKNGQQIGLIDKYVGNPVLISSEQFKTIVQKHNRVWFIAVPDKASLNKSIDDETLYYIMRNFTVVYESYNAKIYLWEKHNSVS